MVRLYLNTRLRTHADTPLTLSCTHTHSHMEENGCESNTEATKLPLLGRRNDLECYADSSRVGIGLIDTQMSLTIEDGGWRTPIWPRLWCLCGRGRRRSVGLKKHPAVRGTLGGLRRLSTRERPQSVVSFLGHRGVSQSPGSSSLNALPAPGPTTQDFGGVIRVMNLPCSQATTRWKI